MKETLNNNYMFSGNKSYSSRMFILLFALVYALALTTLVPMDEISDRVNYIKYYNFSDIIFLKYLSSGYIAAFVNEPLWLFTNITLNKFLGADQAISAIIFFPALITSYLVLSVRPKFFIFLIMLLLFPQVIVKFIVHLRQGLAISIFLLGWFSLSKPLRWVLFGLTPFIHASFFIVLSLYGVVCILQKFRLSRVFNTIVIVAIGLVFAMGLEFVASASRARQADIYDFSAPEVSGFGFLFWLGILGIYWMQGRQFSRENAFVMATIVFYLSTYLFIEVTARIFESSLIVVIIASLGLTSWRGRVCFASFAVFFGLSWAMRLGQPWMGWGAGL